MYDLPIKKHHEKTSAHQYVANYQGYTKSGYILTKTSSGAEKIMVLSELNNLVIRDRYNGTGECVMTISNRDITKMEEINEIVDNYFAECSY